MSFNNLLRGLKKEIQDLMAALSIEEILRNHKLIEMLEEVLRDLADVRV